MRQRIYLATPVNGRKEPTLLEKQKAAYKRIEEMKEYLCQWYPDAEFWSSVGNIVIARKGLADREPDIMGRCVAMVMDCDIVILDYGWQDSRGCRVERYVADQYDKEVYTMTRFRLKEKLKE